MLIASLRSELCCDILRCQTRAHAVRRLFFVAQNFGDMPAGAAGRYGDPKFIAMMMAKVICVQLVSMLGYDMLYVYGVHLLLLDDCYSSTKLSPPPSLSTFTVSRTSTLFGTKTRSRSLRIQRNTTSSFRTTADTACDTRRTPPTPDFTSCVTTNGLGTF